MALEVGGRVPVASVTSLQGEEIQLQQPQQFIHIQFRRFAGCPICDIHLQQFVKRIPRA